MEGSWYLFSSPKKSSNKRKTNLMQKLYHRELRGNFAPHPHAPVERLFSRLPGRLVFCLRELVPSSALASGHVFLGLSKCGQFLLSYTHTTETDDNSLSIVYKYRLHWWAFIPYQRVKKVAEVTLFSDQGVHYSLFIALCQWPLDLTKVLVYGYGEENTDVPTSQACFITITTVPSLHNCQDCLKVAASYEEEDLAASWDSCVRFSCLKHGMTIHTACEIVPPFPKFEPQVSMKKDGAVVINTGNFLHMLRTDLEYLTPSKREDDGEVNRDEGKKDDDMEYEEQIDRKKSSATDCEAGYDISQAVSSSNVLEASEKNKDVVSSLSSKEFSMVLRSKSDELTVSVDGFSSLSNINYTEKSNKSSEDTDSDMDSPSGKEKQSNRCGLTRRNSVDEAEFNESNETIRDTCAQQEIKQCDTRVDVNVCDKSETLVDSDKEADECNTRTNSCLSSSSLSGCARRGKHTTCPEKCAQADPVCEKNCDSIPFPQSLDDSFHGRREVSHLLTENLVTSDNRKKTVTDVSQELNITCGGCSANTPTSSVTFFSYSVPSGAEIANKSNAALVSSTDSESDDSISAPECTVSSGSVSVTVKRETRQSKTSFIESKSIVDETQRTAAEENGPAIPDSSSQDPKVINSKRKMAEKAYEFIDESPESACEKLSAFRKRRLADKKYEFCDEDEDAENIVPFRLLRRSSDQENHILQLSPASSLPSSQVALFDRAMGTNLSSTLRRRFQERNGELLDPSQELTVTVGDRTSRPLLSSLPAASPPMEGQEDKVLRPLNRNTTMLLSPKEPRDIDWKPGRDRRIDMFASEQKGDNPLPLRCGSGGITRDIDLVSSPHDVFHRLELGSPGGRIKKEQSGPSLTTNSVCATNSVNECRDQLTNQVPARCMVQFKRRYIEVDDELISVITDIEDDDLSSSTGYHSALPIEVHGAGYSQLQMISNSKAEKLMAPCVLVHQMSFDVEQYCHEMAQKMCAEAGKKYWFCHDYDVEIVDVCPNSGDVIVVAVMLIQAAVKTKGLAKSQRNPVNSLQRRYYQAGFKFVWNLESGDYSVVDADTLKEVDPFKNWRDWGGMWHPARPVCHQLRKYIPTSGASPCVRVVTNTSVLRGVSLKTIVDTDNLIAIVLQDKNNCL